MSDTDTDQAVRFLRTELKRERERLTLIEARQPTESDLKVLAQTKVNIGELTKALAAYGVHDA